MAFATTDDVKARLGRDLTDGETNAAAYLLEAAAAIICEAAERDEEAILAMDPMPPVLRFIAVELVARALSNPAGLESLEKTLGSYSSAQRFRDRGEGSSDLVLSETEEQMVRRAVNGRLSGSVPVESIVDDVYDSLFGGS